MSKRVLLGLLLLATTPYAQLREGAPGTEAWIAVIHDGVQRVNVECAENVFDPNEIVVSANVPVELSIRGTSDSLIFVNQAFSTREQADRQDPVAAPVQSLYAGALRDVVPATDGSAGSDQEGLADREALAPARSGPPSGFRVASKPGRVNEQTALFAATRQLAPTCIGRWRSR